MQVSADVQQEILKYHNTKQQLTLSSQQEYDSRLERLMACRSVDCPVPPIDGMDLLDKLLVYDPDD